MMQPTAYYAANEHAAVRDRSDRGRLLITGPDRARFLHNLCTNEVKRLAPGAGCEAFVTTPQGKTLAHVTLHALPDFIYVRTDAAALGALGAHLAKYGVFDDVAIEDISAKTVELHVAGPDAERIISEMGGPLPGPSPLDCTTAELDEVPIDLLREAPTGRPGLTLIAVRPAAPDGWLQILVERGAVVLDQPEWEALRIEAGTPVFGRDLTADNLPQELGRDRQAISFVKGCYLGQETVARLDALGHVNKILRGFLFNPGVAPSPGTALMADGKTVGTLTSVAFSPGFNLPIGLGYVRTTHAEAGRTLSIDAGPDGATAVVTDLPMGPPATPRGVGTEPR